MASRLALLAVLAKYGIYPAAWHNQNGNRFMDELMATTEQCQCGVMAGVSHYCSSLDHCWIGAPVASAPPENEPPSDWMHHDMNCACRRFGYERGKCDCGALSEVTE